jgi:hypothetical protein
MLGSANDIYILRYLCLGFGGKATAAMRGPFNLETLHGQTGRDKIYGTRKTRQDEFRNSQ